MPSHDDGRAANSVPVTIITGFLGSGKTTLLNRLLQAPSLADTAVIVNEFGEVSLDHLLIEQAIENAVLLKNGCICCTVRGDIADTLETLLRKRETGELPRFRRIAIETTGLADPAPVVHALLAGPDATMPAGWTASSPRWMRCTARGHSTPARSAAPGCDGGSHPADQDRPGERRRHRVGRGTHRRVEPDRAAAPCGRRRRSLRATCSISARATAQTTPGWRSGCARSRPIRTMVTATTRSAMATRSLRWCCARSRPIAWPALQIWLEFRAVAARRPRAAAEGPGALGRRGPADRVARRASRAAPTGFLATPVRSRRRNTDSADHQRTSQPLVCVRASRLRSGDPGRALAFAPI